MVGVHKAAVSMTGPDFSRPRKRARGAADKLKSTSKRGLDHERDIAKRTGANRVRGSGNKPGRPADVKGRLFLREAKVTSGKGRSIKGEELAKIVEQALRVSRIPVLEVRFEGQKPPTPKDWVMLPASDFDALVEGRIDETGL